MVDFSSHIRRGHPISFGILIFTSLVVGIISAVITHDYNSVSTMSETHIYIYTYIFWVLSSMTADTDPATVAFSLTELLPG